MQSLISTTPQQEETPIIALLANEVDEWKEAQSAAVQNWLITTDFKSEAGNFSTLPDGQGKIEAILFIIAEKHNIWHWAKLAENLPNSLHYYIETDLQDTQEAALGWLLSSYKFNTYKDSNITRPTVRFSNTIDLERAQHFAEAICLVRDLINTPTNDMGPVQLADAAANLANECGANYEEIIGAALLEKNYPTIHAVGRASAQEPRLIDIRWGDESHPKVTLVGKGVCFDTGGLNLKTGNGMGLMKKDMGGAAASLGLASLIMKQKLPICLRVLIPAVENSVSANAMRPSDVLRTRNGLTVEIGNTDAEGRLILADALVEADSENPDLLIDMATLTGASRVALGPDIPSLFTNDDNLAETLQDVAKSTRDPLWRLPLWDDYFNYMKSEIADMDNSGSGGGYAGAITAALFLQKFVTQTQSWAHIDMMAWNTSNRAGRPKGGEAQGLRALFHYLEKTYK